MPKLGQRSLISGCAFCFSRKVLPTLKYFETGGIDFFNNKYYVCEIHKDQTIGLKQFREQVKKYKESKMAAKKKNWIADAVKNKGGLHKALHVPEGEKISAKKLAKGAKSKSEKVRKEVSLAKTLKGFKKK